MSFTTTPHTEVPAATQPALDALAPRERETLRHIAAGHTYLQTARHMGVSRHTVDAYLRRIRAKLGINSTAELTRLAISLGL
ncbi:helix-turn-helix transcriptional regulator [Streptomyces sp. PSKA54]|uniref:Helix-turn-helix transcriptional regulator n=1 Tax=Streptomyces himalayensis subsp. aureolus TaxID=2758039 RepID=A0A7W2CXK9_9ACTN|nr:helix-turn-helix transcriptional regulator [Streptomyces himalayensis]MBA4860801.1 helix-turn-helix transcriptional regulator [Streptomyces himalayensis subsp. aureolus]